MIIVMNDVFEGSSETDIFALEIDKIPSTNKFKSILQKTKVFDDVVVSDDDFDEFDEAKELSRLEPKDFPCNVDKILTVYYE